MKTKTTELEDTTLVAFLSLKNHNITPYQKSDGRVIFTVEGNIASDIQDYYANSKIKVLDCVKYLQTIRSSIFALKVGGKR